MSIIVENITHIYGEGLPHETRALFDVSFTIEDGECVGIIGHTGSGKSTLLQHLNGLLRPKSGRIIVGGQDITDEKTTMIQVRKKIGLVFQYPEYQLFEETVEKDVAFGPKNLDLPEEEIRRRVQSAVERVGLDWKEIRDKSPFDLSGGQKRRVAIAGVLAMEPEVLILDEPTAGLDPQAKEEMLQMIEEIHARTGNITILVSHDMGDMVRLADKVLVMEQGRLAMEGSPREVFSRREKLESMGLAVPPVMKLMRRLADAGMEVSAEEILTMEEAAEAVAKLLHRPEGKKEKEEAEILNDKLNEERDEQ